MHLSFASERRGGFEHHFQLYMYVYEADTLPKCDGFAWVPEEKKMLICVNPIAAFAGEQYVQTRSSALKLRPSDFFQPAFRLTFQAETNPPLRGESSLPGAPQANGGQPSWRHHCLCFWEIISRATQAEGRAVINPWEVIYLWVRRAAPVLQGWSNMHTKPLQTSSGCSLLFHLLTHSLKSRCACEIS